MAHVRVVGQVYPWDLVDDPHRAAALRGAGVDEVAVAAAYHAVRAVAWQEDGSVRLVHEERSALHLEVVDDADDLLLPAPPRSVRPGLFPLAVRSAEEAGLVVRAWLPLTHHDGLAGGPGAVVDLWGGRSRFARCPNDAGVRGTGRFVLEQVVRQTGVRRFLLEALGSLGFVHLAAHDKTTFAALGPLRVQLLSLCFCPACTTAAARAGVDLGSAREVLRDAFLRDEPRRAERVLPGLLRLRADAAARFLRELSAPVDDVVPDLVVAASSRVDALGPWAPVLAPPPGVGLLAQLTGGAGAGWRDLEAWSSSGARLAGSVELGERPCSLRASLAATAPPSTSALRHLDELYLYHLGTRPLESFAELRVRESLRSLTSDDESEPHA